MIELVERRLLRGDHTLLFGDRRIGKSSIIAAALRRMEDCGALIVDIDFSQGIRDREMLTGELLKGAGRAGLSLGGLSSKLEFGRRSASKASALAGRVLNLLATAGFEEVPDGLGDRLADLLDGSSQPELDDALNLLELVSVKQPVIVFFDEAGQMTAWDECGEVADALARIMRRDSRVALAFAGSHKKAASILFGEDGPLHAEGLRVTVEPISDTEWEGALSARFSDLGCTIETKVIRQLLTVSDGHPQDTMRLSACCLDHAQVSGMLIDDVVLKLAASDARKDPTWGKR